MIFQIKLQHQSSMAILSRASHQIKWITDKEKGLTKDVSWIEASMVEGKH